MSDFEKAYTAKEIRTTLDIGDSTLRKWCLALEKHDYIFSRDNQNRRYFLEQDIVVLRHYQTLVQENNMPLDNAANVIASRFSKQSFESRTPSVLSEEAEEINDEHPRRELSNESLNSLMEYIEKQEQFNRELLDRLDKQEERLEERDERLMEFIRKQQEIKQQALEEVASSQEKVEEKRKGFFSRLFKS